MVDLCGLKYFGNSVLCNDLTLCAACVERCM